MHVLFFPQWSLWMTMRHFTTQQTISLHFKIELGFQRKHKDFFILYSASVCYLACLFLAFTIFWENQQFAFNFFHRISFLDIKTPLEITTWSLMPSLTSSDIIYLWHPPRLSASLYPQLKWFILPHQRKLLTYIHCSYSLTIWAHQGAEFYFELSVKFIFTSIH